MARSFSQEGRKPANGVDDTPTKWVEFGPAIHAALQQLQIRNKAFRLPLARGQTQSGNLRALMLPECGGKSHEL
jgi:hypothetical protein